MGNNEDIDSDWFAVSMYDLVGHLGKHQKPKFLADWDVPEALRS